MFKTGITQLDKPVRAPEVLLTTESCRTPTKIKTFLRLSRIATDDSIRQHLNEIDDCHDYFRRQIAPQWAMRSEVISFCATEAQKLRQTALLTEATGSSETPANESLRLDPYALREHNERIQQQYSESDTMRQWTSNEETVETIVRGQTIEVLNDKCGERDWMGDFYRATKLSLRG